MADGQARAICQNDGPHSAVCREVLRPRVRYKLYVSFLT